MSDYRIKIHILPDGFVKTSIETQEGLPTPIEGLALYSKLEPLINEFKKSVRKTISTKKEGK